MGHCGTGSGGFADGGSDDFAHLPDEKPACRQPAPCYLASDYQLQALGAMYRAVILALFLLFSVPAFAQEPVVTITLRDHQFVPAEVPVPAGVKIKLIIRNEQATNAEFESTSLHREKVVNSGGEITVFVGPLDPGSYEFFDDFHTETRGRLVTTSDPWTKAPAR
jgi:hypothetical protein